LNTRKRGGPVIGATTVLGSARVPRERRLVLGPDEELVRVEDQQESASEGEGEPSELL
jgi:hypothetical protein